MKINICKTRIEIVKGRLSFLPIGYHSEIACGRYQQYFSLPFAMVCWYKEDQP
jgi:hypothetical protein